MNSAETENIAGSKQKFQTTTTNQGTRNTVLEENYRNSGLQQGLLLVTELDRREQSFSVFFRSASDFFWNREHFLSRNLLSTGFYPVPLPWGCPQEAHGLCRVLWGAGRGWGGSPWPRRPWWTQTKSRFLDSPLLLLFLFDCFHEASFVALSSICHHPTFICHYDSCSLISLFISYHHALYWTTYIQERNSTARCSVPAISNTCTQHNQLGPVLHVTEKETKIDYYSTLIPGK